MMHILILAALAAFSYLPLAAGAAQPSSPPEIGIVTGPHTGTYYRFGRDIQDMAKSYGVKVEVKESSGSVDNINRINSKENAALGIVQSDILGFLTRSEEKRSRKAAENLRMVFPFYREEVHIMARNAIKEFSDLNGRAVVTGPEGSGSWLTTVNLFGITGVKPAKILRMTPEEGLIEVLKGKADAMIFVAGKPVKLFQNMASLKGYENLASMLGEVHFLPMKDPKVLEEYASAQITPQDYDFVKEPVPAVAVRAVLVSFDFSDFKNSFNRSRCDAIRRLTKGIGENMEGLRKTGHQKWSEVDLAADMGPWKKDVCTSVPAAAPGSASAPSSVAAHGLEKELLNILEDKSR